MRKPFVTSDYSSKLDRVVTCQHSEIREIGQDYDKDGNSVRLIRCQRCGLLMREYPSMLTLAP
jgi:hypothetical protein